jgi:flagellar hook-associated protein 2
MVAISGFGGGLDVDALVSQIMKAERAPVTTLETKQTKLSSQASAYKELKTKLSALESAASSLSDIDVTAAKSAVSSDETVLTASTTGDAIAGRYSVKVTQLASTNTWVTGNSYSSETDEIGTVGQTLTLQVGSETRTITLTEGNNSVTGLADAINQSDLDVTATIVKSGTKYKLALISQESGTEGAITLGGGVASVFTQTAVAQNAVVEINGIAISNSSNSSLSVLQGITLDITKIGSVEVTVNPDSSKITDAINTFIDTYNALDSYIDQQTKYDTETETAGLLAGESTVKNIQYELQAILTQSISGLPESMNSLTSVGINFERDGTLSLDSDTLDDALETNPQGVANLFQVTTSFSDSRASFVYANNKTQSGTYAIHGVSWSGGVVSGSIGGSAGTGSSNTLSSATGIASEGLLLKIQEGATGDLGSVTVSVGFGELISRLADTYTYYNTGAIDQAVSGLEASIDDMGTTIDSMEERLTSRQTMLTKQLIEADTALATMQTKMEQLSQQLAALS